ncbi:helix-turn-helix domain-containing protein [Mycolicibacterium sp. XJ1904]
MGYREFAPPAALAGLAECAWVVDGPPVPVRVVPDGCMDLIRMNGTIMVAGPDITASVTARGPEPFVGLRFRPGVLPRLLGVPAHEVLNERVPLVDLRSVPSSPQSLSDIVMTLASQRPRAQTAPWSRPTLSHITARLAAGSTAAEVAADLGSSPRTLHRQCAAVYGYGPATLRRILRFRRAQRLLQSGAAIVDIANCAGYSDQSHLHREVREFAGVPPRLLRQDVRGANRSTQFPSGSATVA